MSNARTGNSRALMKGDPTRYVICSFCGQPHRRRGKEVRECRRRAGRGQGPVTPPPPAVPVARSSGARTHYDSDPLRGDKSAHAIARKLRAGWTPRKIAKYMGLPVGAVEDVMAKLDGK